MDKAYLLRKRFLGNMDQCRLSKNIEWEKRLIAKLPKKFRVIFQSKFDAGDNGYWQKISEAMAIIVFNDLGISVQEIDFKTVKDKNVDFLAIFEKEKIYTEVKGFEPENYEIAKKGNCFGIDDKKIPRALDRAQPKFLNSSCNILIIADEDTVKRPLYNNDLVDLNKTIETYLNIYDKTSAVMVLGGFFKNQLFKFKIWYNTNPEKLLPQNLVEIFDRNKSNS